MSKCSVRPPDQILKAVLTEQALFRQRTEQPGYKFTQEDVNRLAELSAPHANALIRNSKAQNVLAQERAGTRTATNSGKKFDLKPAKRSFPKTKTTIVQSEVGVAEEKTIPLFDIENPDKTYTKSEFIKHYVEQISGTEADPYKDEWSKMKISSNQLRIDTERGGDAFNLKDFIDKYGVLEGQNKYSNAELTPEDPLEKRLFEDLDLNITENDFIKAQAIRAWNEAGFKKPSKIEESSLMKKRKKKKKFKDEYISKNVWEKAKKTVDLKREYIDPNTGEITALREEDFKEKIKNIEKQAEDAWNEEQRKPKPANGTRKLMSIFDAVQELDPEILGSCKAPFTDFTPEYEQNLRIYYNKQDSNPLFNKINCSIFVVFLLFLSKLVIKCYFK